MIILKEEKTTVAIPKLGIDIEIVDCGDGFINVEIKGPSDKVRLAQPFDDGGKYFRLLKTYFNTIGTRL